MKFRNQFSINELRLLEQFQSPRCRACNGTCQDQPEVIADCRGINQPINLGSPTVSIFYRCLNCNSLNDSNAQQSYYSEEIDTDFISYYCDTAAGIDEMIEPILRYIRYKDKKSISNQIRFLELGCGLGYVVDFTQRVLNWHSVGLEPGSWGKHANKLIGAPVFQNYIGSGSRFDKQTFDLIYASEVIEHIQEPDSFMTSLINENCERVDILLTTPNAEYITELAPRHDIYSLLFPGEHKVIYSLKGLSCMLLRKDIQIVYDELRHDDKNLLVIATYDKDFSDKGKQAEINQQSNVGVSKNSRDLITTYYHAVLRELPENKPDQLIRRGVFYRLFKSYINAGRTDDAYKLLSRIQSYDRSFDVSDLPYEVSTSVSDLNDARFLSILLNVCSASIHNELNSLLLSSKGFCLGSPSYHKLLGFYLCTLVHSRVNPGHEYGEALYRQVISYLSLLLDMTLTVEASSTPHYYLELISLKGPALASLILAKTKINQSFNIELDYKYVNTSEFKKIYPVSFSEIQEYCLQNSHLIQSDRQSLEKQNHSREILTRIAEKILFYRRTAARLLRLKAHSR